MSCGRADGSLECRRRAMGLGWTRSGRFMAGRIIKGGKGDRRGNRTTPVIGEPLEQRLLLSATLIKDLNTLPSSTILPAPLTRVGSLAYFAGNDGVHGSELWKTNGTSAGTVMVKDI